MSIFRSMDLVQIKHEPGSRVKGSWVEGREIPIPFKGTAQPAPGKAMERLPDGKRSSEGILVFAPIKLDFTTADPVKKLSSDIIVWEGRRYEVQIAGKWNVGGEVSELDHWELIATREKEGET